MLAAAGACSGSPGGPTGLVDVVTTVEDGTVLEGAARCEVTTAREQAPNGNRQHVPECSDELTFDSIPPNSGRHYSIWADFQFYDAPIPWGYLVHSMEHGAVVLFYKCEADCTTLEADLRRFYDTYRADSACSNTDARHRLIVVPDPTLDVPFAAAAWGYVYRATCWHEPSLRAFVDAHYGQAPEQICTPGRSRPVEGWCGQGPAVDASVPDADLADASTSGDAMTTDAASD